MLSLPTTPHIISLLYNHSQRDIVGVSVSSYICIKIYFRNVNYKGNVNKKIRKILAMWHVYTHPKTIICVFISKSKL